jgi:spermidine synthase
VIPTVVIDRASSPGGEQLVLSQHGKQFSIRVAGVELMSSVNHGSEDQLGRMSCESLKVPAPRILIGGLGMGFTLRAALDALPATASVDIVEIVPSVVHWNRTVYGQLANHPLNDSRVTLIEDDVAQVIERGRDYDAIVLDVDNGPDGVYRDNRGLYQRRGLEAMYTALVPGGLLTVWSCFESPTFTRWLRDVGFTVELRNIKAKYKGGPRHCIWFATKSTSRPAS